MSAPPAPGKHAGHPMAERLQGKSPFWRALTRVSIQSKLMFMLLVMSVLATAIIGFIGFTSGRTSLRAAVFDRLTAAREAQARVLELGLADIMGTVQIYASSGSAIGALSAFTSGYDQLADTTITPEQQKSLVDFYTASFGGGDNGNLDINALLPSSNAGKYLQSAYTIPLANGGQVRRADDPGDGSAWAAANARYDEYFQKVVARKTVSGQDLRLIDLQDVLLIDADGDVVYSALKGPDLGTNIFTGPYRGQGYLPEAFRKAMASNDTDYVVSTDFADYLPASKPTAWMVAPIGAPGRQIGAIAIAYPISAINFLMTAEKQWERAGMGRTGETFLVGPDDLMRSDSRLFLEDPEAYRREVTAAGTPAEVADRAIREGTTVLVQPIDTSVTQAAQRGETGTMIATDYLGRRSLVAFAPAPIHRGAAEDAVVRDVAGHWVIVALIGAEEAFAPERKFAKRLVQATVTLVFVACLAAMLWSRLFVRPIRRLETGAQQISAGNYNVSLPVESKDEFGDLTAAFNEMSRNLAVKDQLLEEQRTENDQLLRSLMPESVVEKYREGHEAIAEEHQDATVIFADFIGLDELSADVSPEESVGVVNKLVKRFDAAAESLGVERVRNTHNGYLASCGLTVPRLDNIHRTVEFATEMQHIVERFNVEGGYHLQLRAGIDSGTVTSGLVGRAGLVYDLWGGAVQLAASMRQGITAGGIYVSDAVYQATRDTRRYEAAGTIEVGDRTEQTWRLVEDQS